MIGDMKLEVLDPAGKVLATLPGGKRKGINRVAWNTRLKAPKVAPAATLAGQQWSFFGPQVAEGTYGVRVLKGDEKHEGSSRW